MKNKELYFKTVDILVKAYLQGTLEHSYCNACAVGNIVAANNNLKVKRFAGNWMDANGNQIVPMWSNVFLTDSNGNQSTWPSCYIGIAKNQIDSTGYSWEQLAKIEQAFESTPENGADKMFNGLMAVVNTLDIIHENTDQKLTTTVKAKFQKVNQ